MTTPFSLVRLLSSHCFLFLRLYHLVLDEADQLFTLAPDQVMVRFSLSCSSCQHVGWKLCDVISNTQRRLSDTALCLSALRDTTHAFPEGKQQICSPTNPVTLEQSTYLEHRAVTAGPGSLFRLMYIHERCVCVCEIVALNEMFICIFIRLNS